MKPQRTRTMRASIVGRARFIEDLVKDKQPAQYVLLGAGLDSFAPRASPAGLPLFAVEQPGTQAWKPARLTELGFARPEWLHFVPVDFVELLDERFRRDVRRRSAPERLAAREQARFLDLHTRRS